MADFEKPHRDDVVLNLSMLCDSARDRVIEECGNLEQAFRSARPSPQVVKYIADSANEVHSRYLQEAMDVLVRFLGRMEATPRGITDWAKPELQKMPGVIIAEINSQAFPELAKTARQHFQVVFQKRIDHALREFQVGRVNGEPIKAEVAAAAGAQQGSSAVPAYVSQDRLEALRAIRNSQFDLNKLIRLCDELNSNYAAGTYYSVAMLVRAILDHVPPMFSATKFEGVRAQHGGASFKQQMDHLDQSSRKIADAFLHEHVRRREVLPTDTQVYCAPALDTLLGEVAVKLQ
jgi:hypothetical protein